MPAKQKHAPEIVIKAAHFINHPEHATLTDIKSMAARLVDDSKPNGTAHKTSAIKAKTKKAVAAAQSANPAVKKSRAA